MKLDKILGKVLALSKEIYLTNPPNDLDLSSEFFPYSKNCRYPSGIALKWYYSKKALNICDDIALMAMSYDTTLKYGDKYSFSEIILRSLEENAIKHDLYNIFSNTNDTLFNSILEKNISRFSNLLWRIISKKMKESICDWLILYPLIKVTSPSYKLNSDGIYILNSNDIDFWKSISGNFPSAKYWDPVTCKNVEGDSVFNLTPTPNSWLICEISGTKIGSKINAALFMRKFLAVLFSYKFSSNLNLFTKSMAEPFIYSIQFPSDESKVGTSQILSGIGELIPPFGIQLNITEDILNKVSQWYYLLSISDEIIQHRATKSAHFINYAICSDSLERFIFFFISLDALFGKRDSVKKSIINGVTKHLPSDKWDEKVELLFKLRSELVHGGSSFIEEWKGLDPYLKHFKSNPMSDVEYVALYCLINYFS